MNPATYLLIYGIGVVLLSLLALLIALTFARYRFENDKTYTFFTILVVMFLLAITSTVLLTRGSTNSAVPAGTTFTTFQ